MGRRDQTTFEFKDGLRSAAERAAKAEERSLGGQIRHWIRRGAMEDGYLEGGRALRDRADTSS